MPQCGYPAILLRRQGDLVAGAVRTLIMVVLLGNPDVDQLRFLGRQLPP